MNSVAASAQLASSLHYQPEARRIPEQLKNNSTRNENHFLVILLVVLLPNGEVLLSSTHGLRALHRLQEALGGFNLKVLEPNRPFLFL